MRKLIPSFWWNEEKRKVGRIGLPSEAVKRFESVCCESSSVEKMSSRQAKINLNKLAQLKSGGSQTLSNRIQGANVMAQQSLKAGKEHLKRAVKVVKMHLPRRNNAHAKDTLKTELDLQKNPPEESLESILRSMWTSDCDDLPLYKDLPRLVRRVRVRGVNKTPIFNAKSEAKPPGNVPTAELMAMLVKKISEVLESDEKRDSVHKATDELLAGVTEETELTDFAETLCSQVGKDSKTVKVLKCIHQNVVLQATWKLKMTVTSEFMTKDVKGDEGWQILITLAEFAQVKHIRREQSIDFNGDSKNHWEFSWEVSMTFDKELDVLTDTRLSVTEVSLQICMSPGKSLII